MWGSNLDVTVKRKLTVLMLLFYTIPMSQAKAISVRSKVISLLRQIQGQSAGKRFNAKLPVKI